MNRLTFLAAAGGTIAASAAARPARASESDIALSTPTGTLFGTLVIPAKIAPPVVLVIAGSGPTDRNGNGMGIMPNDYALLADALSERGVASLRYDKRGIGESAMAAESESGLRFETLVDDAVAWVRWLRADGRFSRIVVAGHSEGSLIGMLAAQKVAVGGFVSLEGAGRPAAVILREQLKRNASPETYAKSDAIITQLQQGRTVSDSPPELAMLFRASVQPYLISWFKYDPAVEIAKLRVPATIVQGTADVQVGMEDARALQSANPNAKLVVVDGMNHVLKHAPDTSSQSAIVAGYRNSSLPVEPQVVAAVYASAAA